MLIVGTKNAAGGVMLGLAILEAGGSAVDAVEAVLRAVEDNEADDSVGWGGLPNLLGEVEQDASIMDGHRLRTGAVGALRGVRYPSYVARRVMDLLPHVFLVGEGAARFAREVGAEPAPVGEASQAKYRRWVESVGIADDLARDGGDLPLRDLVWRSVRHRPGGTANAIAIDGDGHVCSGVTTSGWGYKYPGRLGDSPIIGAGHYADDRYGACACTGLGEATIRLCSAHMVVQLLAVGQNIEEAAAAAAADLNRLDVPIPFSVNILAVSRTGPPYVPLHRDRGADLRGGRARRLRAPVVFRDRHGLGAVMTAGRPVTKPRLLRRPEVLAGGAVLVAALCLYLLTLDNGLRLEELKGGDLITHQYAQVEGRPSNAPGYPLYTMGGWLWFRAGKVLLGGLISPVEVLSLYSTLWAVAALALLYILGLRLGGGRWPLAVAATAFYAVTYFFWYYAVSTEQYGSAVFQTLALLLLALVWQRKRRDRYLYWMAFVAGTCLANLVTVAFIVPGLMWFVLSQEPSLLRRRRLLLRLAGLALLPAAYAYVYVRGAQHPEWRGQGEWPSTMAWFLSFVSTGQGRQEMTLQLWPPDLSYLTWWPMNSPGPRCLAGLLGLALLERHQAVFAYVTLGIYLLFSYVDRYGNWFQVVMPVYPLLALGCVSLGARAATLYADRRLVVAVATVLMAVAGGERLLTNLPRTDLRDAPDDNALCLGQSILLDLWRPTAPATIAVTYDEELSLQYLATVYGLGGNLKIAAPTEVDDAVAYSRGAPCRWRSHLPASLDRAAGRGRGRAGPVARRRLGARGDDAGRPPGRRRRRLRGALPGRRLWRGCHRRARALDRP